MLAGRAKPLRIIGDPDNQRPDKLSSAILTYLLHGAESFWRSKRFSVGQETLRILWNPKVHYEFTKFYFYQFYVMFSKRSSSYSHPVINCVLSFLGGARGGTVG